MHDFNFCEPNPYDHCTQKKDMFSVLVESVAIHICTYMHELEVKVQDLIAIYRRTVNYTMQRCSHVVSYVASYKLY